MALWRNMRVTAATKRAGLHDNPLGMRSRIGVGEAADLALLIIQQPADTLLRWVPFNLWSVLVRHTQSLKGLHRAVELVFKRLFTSSASVKWI